MIKRIAHVNENCSAIEWLINNVSLKKPTIWVGHGISFSLAQVFAETFQKLGVLSFALTTNEIFDLSIDANIAYISRSAVKIPHTDFIITKEGCDISWTKAPCLSVMDIDQGLNPWVALDYTVETLVTFSNALNISYPKNRYETKNKFNTDSMVLIFERHTKPIQSLCQACNAKLDFPTLVSLGRDEVGHGFHYKLWRNPEKFVLNFFINPNMLSLWEPLYQWTNTVKIEVNTIFLDSSTPLHSQAIENFYIACEAIKEFSKQNNLILSENPMPDEFDKLR